MLSGIYCAGQEIELKSEIAYCKYKASAANIPQIENCPKVQNLNYTLALTEKYMYILQKILFNFPILYGQCFIWKATAINATHVS